MELLWLARAVSRRVTKSDVFSLFLFQMKLISFFFFFSSVNFALKIGEKGRELSGDTSTLCTVYSQLRWKFGVVSEAALVWRRACGKLHKALISSTLTLHSTISVQRVVQRDQMIQCLTRKSGVLSHMNRRKKHWLRNTIPSTNVPDKNYEHFQISW